MRSVSASLVAALLAGSGLVAGQLNSKCNPVKGDKCPPNAAFSGDVTYDFTKMSKSDLEKGWQIDDGIKYNPDRLILDNSKGAAFAIRGIEDAPTINTHKYLFYGKVEVTVQAAPGQGIITSVVLASDCEDEIDWEFVGSHTTQVETNFFSKGNPKFNTYNATIPVANTVGNFHTYTVEWTQEFMAFSIDGGEVRRSFSAAADGGKDWPQTPMRVKLGTWIAGNPKTQNQGTIDWAGGPVNMADAPFVGYVKSVHIVDYTTGAKEYIYKDATGTHGSIEIVKGSSSDSGSSSSSPSSTKAPGSSSTVAPTTSPSASAGSNSTSPRPSTTSGSGPSGTQSAGSVTTTTSAPGAAPRFEAASTMAIILFMGYMLLW